MLAKNNLIICHWECKAAWSPNFIMGFALPSHEFVSGETGSLYHETLDFMLF
jgi:hypothetical protein